MQSKKLLSFIIVIVSLIIVRSLVAAPNLHHQENTNSRVRSHSPIQENRQPENLNLLNQLGGIVATVAIQGNYAYIGKGPRLVSIDIQNPTNLNIIGQSEILSGVVWHIEVIGNYAYVNSEGDLSIIDISNPAAPSLVGFYDVPGRINDFIISGSYLYIAEAQIRDGSQYLYGGLRILDITTPTTPIQIGYAIIGRDDEQQSAKTVAVYNDYAYLLAIDGSIGLSIVDISDPTSPTEVNFQSNVGLLSMAISGNYLYTGDQFGVVIRDLSTPAAPVVLGGYLLSSYVYDIYPVGNWVYVTTPEQGMTIIDFTVPDTPAFIGSYAVPGYQIPEEVYVTGNYAYIAYGRIGLRTVDVSTPTNPVEVADYDYISYMWGIETVGNYGYVLDVNGLQIFDISNQLTPVKIGEYPIDGGPMVVTENHVYIFTGFTLSIIDVTNPSIPVLAGEFPTPYSGRDVIVDSNYVYVIDGNHILHIIDVSNPAVPAQVGLLILPGYSFSLAKNGNYTFVAGADLYVVDVTAVTTPTLAATLPTNYQHVIDIADNHAYLGGDDGLLVVDISNPTQPTEAGNYDLGEIDYTDIEVVNDYVYVTGWADENMVMLDISNPALPVLVDGVTIPGYAGSITAVDNHLYVAAVEGGWAILDFGLVPMVTFSNEDSAVIEGNVGTTNIVFTVTLESIEPLTQAVSVDYVTVDGTAVSGEDYMPISGTLSLSPDQTTHPLTVTIIGDTNLEPDETFFVNLSDPTNATITDGQAIGTILNDEEVIIPDVSITDVSSIEGNDLLETAVFTISLSTASNITVTMEYSTTNGTAVSDSDYTPTSGTLVFTPGEISKTLSVNIFSDSEVEPNETFFVSLFNVTNAVIVDTQGQGTILNDDQTTFYVVFLPVLLKP